MSKKINFHSSLIGLQNNLFSFALKLTMNREEAQDLLQDTTLKALNNEDKFVEDSNFKGWVMTIMRNIFINNYRKSTRENVLVDTTDDLYHLNLSHTIAQDSPEGAYSIGEISKILDKFPEDYRHPFSLHIAGYKYEEIAEQLNMNLGTVKSHIFHTRRKMREILKDYR